MKIGKFEIANDDNATIKYKQLLRVSTSFLFIFNNNSFF